MRRARALSAQLAHALVWWMEGLWLGLPAAWQRRWFPPRPKATYILKGSIVQAELLDSAGKKKLFELDLAAVAADVESQDAAAEVTLVMSRDDILTRSFSLPLVSERDLKDVLRHEIDRTTPFSPDEIYFDYDVTSKDQASGLLRVMVAIARRQTLDAVLRELGVRGVRPDTVTAVGSAGEPLSLNLLGQPRVRRLPFATPYLRPIYACGAVVALVAALYAPLLRYVALDNEYRAAAESARRGAVEARQVAAALSVHVERAAFLDELQTSYVPPITILAQISNALPDDTWLSRFTLTSDTVQLHGEAAGASRVLELLTGVDALERAEFQSPVSVNSATLKESFSVSARLRGSSPR